MDWYLQRKSDFAVLNDQVLLEAPATVDRSSLLSDWCQWGFIRPEKFKSVNIHAGKSTVDEFVYDRQSPYAQVSKSSLVHEGEGSNSSVWREPPAYGQPDSQMELSMDWMDEIFLNSLLEEDNGSSLENFLTDMLPDPALTVLVPAELNESNEGDAVLCVDEPECLEAMLLQELGDILIHLSGNMRICFRDSLYRLGENSKEQYAISHLRSANFVNSPSFIEVKGESPRNIVVDRTIADLIFNKPYFQDPDPQYY